MTTKTERIIRALEARGFVRVELPRSPRLCYTGINKGGRRVWVWPDKMGGLRGASQPRYSASLTLTNTAKKLLLGEDTATVPLMPVPEIEVPSATQPKKPHPRMNAALTPAQERYEAETYSSALRASLSDLRVRLADGWELPDACYRAARRRGFTVDEVRRAYDAVEAQVDAPEGPTPPETSDDAFTRAWAKMEARGFKYGADALEQVKLGWRLARGEL